jgi:hypothetical protein
MRIGRRGTGTHDDGMRETRDEADGGGTVALDVPERLDLDLRPW